jgi:hypothetical protein
MDLVSLPRNSESVLDEVFVLVANTAQARSMSAWTWSRNCHLPWRKVAVLGSYDVLLGIQQGQVFCLLCGAGDGSQALVHAGPASTTKPHSSSATHTLCDSESDSARPEFRFNLSALCPFI